MIRKKIESLIEKAIKELQKKRKFPRFEIPKIKIEHPAKESYGDYATNVAMIISQKTGINIVDVTTLLISEILSKREAKNLFKRKRLSTAGGMWGVGAETPFINFFISEEYLQKQVSEILKEKERFGSLKIGKNKKVQVEFISANPTGPLTIGNARGGPFGDVLANVFKKAGFRIEKAYYINDYGMQILTLGHSVLKDKEAKYKGDYIDYLNKVIKEKDPYKTGERAAKIIIKEMIKKTTDKMGIKYDEWDSEMNFHHSGGVDKALDFLKKKEFLYKKEGAWWFQSSKFGDERDRVVIKKDGWKTYLASDIAYHRYKFEKKKFTKVINIWGADHYGDVPGLQAAVEALGHKGKLDIILLQFVSLFEGKKKIRMSKRRGVYVTMDELLKEVGFDVVRFFFLNRAANTHLNFDLKLAKEQSEKNPVYYVQYAFARICSILRKLGAKDRKLKVTSKDLNSLKEPAELNLIKQLVRFPEIIEDTVKDYQVQRIPQYSTDLATSFHRFYKECRVITENKEIMKARVSLIKASKIVLKNTLDLMGISSPEKM